MALVLLDRAKETTTVVGTGTATLLGAVTSYQSLAGVGNGNTTYYCIVDQVGANWEVGIGTYTASGTTLARTTVLASSNAGALVVFTTGVKDVFVTYPSEKGVWYDASGNVLFTGTTTAANLAYTGTLTGSTGILNIGSGQVYKDASGNVGIGTSSPASRLDVKSTAAGTADIRLSFSASDYMGLSSESDGYQLTAVGGTNALRFATGGSQRMRIDSSGNVGIGTSSPASYGSPLTVYLAANPTLTIASGNANAYLRLYSTSDANMYLGNIGGSMAMLTANTIRMSIDATGNVGIGTTSPSGKLDVAGTIKTLGYTVATLPTGVVGARAYVTNALAPTFGATVVTGGAVTIPVFYNGTNWIVG